MLLLRVIPLFAFAVAGAEFCFAEPPTASYIFPAGGRRGETTSVRIGGHYFHERARLELLGTGVTLAPTPPNRSNLPATSAPESSSTTWSEIVRTERIWFEGPLIRQPASQQREDYPQDYVGQISVATNAPLGPRYWRVVTGQGATSVMPWIVGDLPELVEQEVDGNPIPNAVSLPVTINGRIFPREDVDLWTFDASAGQTFTCTVAAAEFGSPLEARLEILDAHGRPVERDIHDLPRVGIDPQVRFTATQAGTYSVRISDYRYSGAQNHVYRLTITSGAWVDSIFPLGGRRGSEISVQATGHAIPGNQIIFRVPDVSPGVVRPHWQVDGSARNSLAFEVEDLNEQCESDLESPPILMPPVVANGRIESPGDADTWTLPANKGVLTKLELRAARLGSPLDGVLIVKDASGKELARGQELPGGSSDCELEFRPPEDGVYAVEVSENFASRGGPAFAYRLRVTQPKGDFRLSVGTDVLIVDIGGEKKIPVSVRREGGFNVPITLRLDGLPGGATAGEVTIAPNQNKADFVVKLDKSVPVQWARVRLIGRAEWQEEVLERQAVVNLPNSDVSLDHLLLACALPTPFRFHAEFQLRYVPRGGKLRKSYRIDRNGFEGPLEVRLADRQGRHLQGVVGKSLTVPTGSSEFEYDIYLPPWMELGRTSRTNLMLTGQQTDSLGNSYPVTFTTTDQNEQLIALVSPAPLRLSVERSSSYIRPNQEFTTTLRIHRDRSLSGPCNLDLVIPSHMRSISARPVEAPDGAETAELKIQFGDVPGPLNMPLIVRGVMEKDGSPVVAETPIEFLLAE